MKDPQTIVGHHLGEVEDLKDSQIILHVLRVEEEVQMKVKTEVVPHHR